MNITSRIYDVFLRTDYDDVYTQAELIANIIEESPGPATTLRAITKLLIIHKAIVLENAAIQLEVEEITARTKRNTKSAIELEIALENKIKKEEPK